MKTLGTVKNGVMIKHPFCCGRISSVGRSLTCRVGDHAFDRRGWSDILWAPRGIKGRAFTKISSSGFGKRRGTEQLRSSSGSISFCLRLEFLKFRRSP